MAGLWVGEINLKLRRDLRTQEFDMFTAIIGEEILILQRLVV